MADQSYPIGLRNDLLTAENFRKMGITIWVYAWLVDRVTDEYERPDGETRGKVLGGAVITADTIATDYGLSPQTIRNHIQALYRAGYIERRQRPGGYQIEIRHSRKWVRAAPLVTPNPSPPSDSDGVRLTDSKGHRVERSCESESLRLLKSREPSIKTMQIDTDTAKDSVSIHPEEEGAHATESAPEAEPDRVWHQAVDELSATMPAAAAAGLRACAVRWERRGDTAELVVAVPPDAGPIWTGRHTWRPLIRQALQDLTGHRHEVTIVEQDAPPARAGP